MVFPIAGGNESKGTQQNSLRFNDDDSPNLNRTISSGSDITKFTYSFWVKRSGSLGSIQRIISNSVSSSKQLYIRFTSSDTFEAFHTAGGTDSGSYVFYLQTTAKFRDVSAWYHIVVKFDSTQSTEADRTKIYVNGNETTALEDNTQPSQNEVAQFINTNERQDIGYYATSSSEYFDGYLADLNFINGTASHTDFGEFDSTSNIWKHKDYDGSYGTNGYRLEFQQTGTSQNATGIGADTSGQGNHFAVSNLAATDVTTDSPTNNFATMSKNIHPSSTNFTISEGNLKISKSGTGTVGLYGQTLMPTSGKWYFEVKIVTRGTSDRTRVGIANYESVTGTGTIQDNYSGVEISTASDDKIFTVVDGSTTEDTSFYTALSDNDIVRFAVDMDNGRLYLGVNGNWWNYSSSQTGGDPTSGSGYVTNNTTIFNGSPMTAYSAHSAGLSTSSVQEFNFGNPTFAISSSNADDNGYGNFEYSVPSGYYALNTKNLAEFG